jgi:cob(I)alamin adenosyltransferase
MAKGLIHIYTGDGKGKTTSAFGLALRASGHGKRILILQFLKGGKKDSGEIAPARKSGIEVIRFEDQITPLFDKKEKPSVLKKSIDNSITLTINKLKDSRYDLIILDEIITALSSELLSKEDLQRIIDAKHDDTELVLTGRGAPEWLINRVDYVTEMRKIKHPFDKRIKARKGIEF